MIIVPEADVLVAAAKWLWQRNVLPLKFSLPRGRGIDVEGVRNRLIAALKTVGMPPEVQPYLQFDNEGPDLVGYSALEYWQIECKGVGKGKPQTQRNNFDRALASVVAYYTDAVPTDTPGAQALYLGLALPITSSYISELRHRARRPLRRQLNLWVLLYERESRNIRPISPHEDYESFEGHYAGSVAE